MASVDIAELVREKHEEIVRILDQVEMGLLKDVDLLVMWREGTSLLDHAALMLELESLLGRKVDIASDGWVKPSIRESVYRDAVAL